MSSVLHRTSLSPLVAVFALNAIVFIVTLTYFRSHVQVDGVAEGVHFQHSAHFFSMSRYILRSCNRRGLSSLTSRDPRDNGGYREIPNLWLAS